MTRRRLGRPRLGLQSLVDRGPTHEVTRIGDEEPDDAFPSAAIWDEVKALYRSGLHPAIALHVRHRGRVVLDRTIGHLWNPPGGEPGPVASPDALFSLFSASKIVTATLVHALAEDGLLSLSDPVVAYLPEFGCHGKEHVLLRHLLQHTAGIPDMPRFVDVERTILEGRVDVDALCAVEPATPPGAYVAYHPLTAWFLLQEVVERVTGGSLREALRRRVLDPLGFRHLCYGVDASELDRVARHAVTGPPVPGFMAAVFDRSIGIDLETAIHYTNRPEFLTAIVPSANVIGTPRDVGRFMQMLLDGGELDGVRVLRRETVRRMVTDVTPLQLDGTFGFPMRYGLGVMMGAQRFSLFGMGTRGAFGHLGLTNVVVYADPARELAVAFLNTGKPMMAPGMLRWYAVLQAIASRVPRR